MNTRKLRKAILTLCSALLLVSLSVGATLAYLTASTEVVENTFTVGNVTIDLDEADVNEYGKKLDKNDKNEDDDEFAEDNLADRVKENEYKLLPGHEYCKDPIVYVEEKSEPCYVFVKIVNGLSEIESEETGVNNIAAQMEVNGWKEHGTETGVYYYINTDTNVDEDGYVVDARNGEVQLPVFEKFTIKGDIENTALAAYATAADAKNIITIDAYAIQADGFDTALEAWDAQSVDWTKGDNI